MNKKLLTVLMSTSIILTACSNDSAPKSKPVKDIKTEKAVSDLKYTDSWVEGSTKYESTFFELLDYYSDKKNIENYPRGNVLKMTRVDDTIEGNYYSKNAENFSFTDYRYRENKDNGKVLSGKYHFSADKMGDNEKFDNYELTWYNDKEAINYNFNVKGEPKEKLEKTNEDLLADMEKDYQEVAELFKEKYAAYKRSYKEVYKEKAGDELYLYWKEPKNNNETWSVGYHREVSADDEIIEEWNKKEYKDIFLKELDESKRQGAKITDIGISSSATKPGEEEYIDKDIFFSVDVYYQTDDEKYHVKRDSIKMSFEKRDYDIDEKGKKINPDGAKRGDEFDILFGEPKLGGRPRTFTDGPTISAKDAFNIYEDGGVTLQNMLGNKIEK